MWMIVWPIEVWAASVAITAILLGAPVRPRIPTIIVSLEESDDERLIVLFKQ